MASFNRVIIMGNLTRDPQTKFTPTQMAICEFGVASNRKFKDKEEVCFVDCAAFGKTAEVIQQHFEKGKPILVEGRLKWDSWDDKNGGGKRSKLSVVVENFSFVSDGGGQGAKAGPERATVGAGSAIGEDTFDKADIPF